MASSRDREGYILIDRNMCEWRWWQKHNTVIVFLWLLMKAQFHESYFKGVKISRGQVATSVTNIEKSNGLSRQEVRTAISNLKSTNAITTERYHNFVVITIVNYDEYQNLTIKKTKSQLSSNHLVTILQPHTNTYNTYNTGERSNMCSAQQLPCGATEKPKWMTDSMWEEIKFRTAEDIPGVEQGFYDTYIEYVEELHEQGREIS